MKKPFDGEFPVTQRFGEKITNPAGHTGIDYALYLGTPVLAAMDGKVSRIAELRSGYGTHVIVDHGGGLQTIYAHLSRVTVEFGETVREGQLLGYSGNTGNSTGPHLHFEVRRLGQPIDPDSLFSASRETKAGDRRVKIPCSFRTGNGVCHCGQPAAGRCDFR